MSTKIIRSALEGVFVIEPAPDGKPPADPWGEAGLGYKWKPVQSSILFSKKKGTLHGLYYQADPFGEKKVVRCTMGAVCNIVVDLRPGSENYLKWISIDLSDRSGRTLFVPEGMAHGFMTIRDNTEIFMEVSQFYRPQFARGIRWDDPAFGFKWPMEVRTISTRDSSFPDFASESSGPQAMESSEENTAALVK